MNCQNLKLKYTELLAKSEEFRVVNERFQQMKPDTVTDRRAVSDELQLKQEIITKFIQENFDSILWQEKIIKAEKAVLEKYFNKMIDVPKIPKEVTREKMEFWKSIGFAIHYSPGLEITKDNKFDGQKKKLDNDIYVWSKEGRISAEATKLPEGWILVDARPKPNYDEYGTEKSPDILAPVLEELRKTGHIQVFKHMGSRFNISPDELDKPEVKSAIAKAIRVNTEQLNQMPATLFNYLGNAFYKEGWDETSANEWFKEKYYSGYRLYGGISDHGGLSFVNSYSSGARDVRIGFRPLVYFP